jgi:hypothetical protein
MSLAEITNPNNGITNIYVSNAIIEDDITVSSLHVSSLNVTSLTNGFMKTTNANGTVQSASIQISDVQNLDTELNNKLSNPSLIPLNMSDQDINNAGVINADNLITNGTNINNYITTNNSNISTLNTKTRHITSTPSSTIISSPEIVTPGIGNGSNICLAPSSFFNNPGTMQSVIIGGKTVSGSSNNQLVNSCVIGCNSFQSYSGTPSFNGHVVVGQFAGNGCVNNQGCVIIGRNSDVSSNYNFCIALGCDADANLDDGDFAIGPQQKRIRPQNDNFCDLGHSSYYFKNIYANTLNMKSGSQILGNITIPSFHFATLVINNSINIAMTANLWRFLNVTSINGGVPNNGFTNDLVNGLTTYNGTTTRTFRISCDLSSNVSNANTDVNITFSKNGNLVPLVTDPIISNRFITSGINYNLNVNSIIQLAPNDTIRVIARASNSTNLVISSMIVNISSLMN